MLSLHCHEQASFSCSEQRLFDSCRERDSLCGGFSRCVGSSGRDWWALEHRLSSRGARAWLLCGMWDLLGPGIEPVSLVLESGCLTTGPPGRSKSPKLVLVFTPFTQIIWLHPLLPPGLPLCLSWWRICLQRRSPRFNLWVQSLGLGRSPGKGKGYPLQYSCLENSMDCIVHWVVKSQTGLSDFHCHLSCPQGVKSVITAAPLHKMARGISMWPTLAKGTRRSLLRGFW